MAVNQQYERSALTPSSRESMQSGGGGGGEMRGVVIISMPRTDSEGKTLCAAFAVQGQQQQQQQQPQQQNVSSVPSSAAVPMRRLRRRRRIRRFSLCAIVVAAAIFLWLRGPTLTTNSEEQEEDEDKQVHVYTLYPKYAPVRTKMVQMRRTLLERDMQRLGRVATNNGNATAVVPIRGNIYPDGLYYMALLVGRPAKLYFLDMDTGSDLTWLQCDAPCRSCAPGPHGLYDPRKAELVDCRLPVCSHVQSGSSYSCNAGGVNQCDYDVEYADGSSTMGVLMQDFITLMLINGTRTQRKAVLGCGYDQQGALAQSPASTDGVLGLSNSKVALSSQLAEQGIINNVIGHCLAGGSNGGGYLFFGDELVPSWGMTWAPLLGRPAMENYQTHLYSIRYGGDKVEMNGDELSGLDGGTIFDSGTSFTYLVPEVYRTLLAVIQEQAIRSGLVQVESDDTLPFCWRGASPFQSVSDVSRYFKSVTLDFGGSNWFSTGRTMDLTPDGYLIISTQGNVCLGILDASGASIEAMNIVGDISMRGYLVVYDNVQQRIGWIRRNCHNRPTRMTNQFTSLFN